MDGQIYGTFLTMMRLGSYKFCIYTAAYQELNRTTNYKWGEQAVFGDWDNLQYLGQGEDTQSLTGVVYPEFKGGTSQIDELRALAATGIPQLLISGTGKILGYWVINSITEGQTKFAAFGVPRRQEFTINMRKYSDSPTRLGLLSGIMNAVGI
ncbi:phage tail protein [Acinetobacter johnsonii]|uniref:Phage P2 GpU n=1 Tax=Acinetobacter johnsonii TaxID=40214 RepID=A0A1R7Q9P2_ACIJO|nr:phage tail protein [Acinetobacter johnsonii]SJX20956.1 Phage P2 GpU [Acinetobacter johnsonii]